MKKLSLKPAAAATLLLMLLAAPACSATPTATPFEPVAATGTFAPVAAPTAAVDKVKILVPGQLSASNYSSAVEIINRSLEQAGQMVEFTARKRNYNSNGGNDFITIVRTELASGQPKFDAYAFDRSESLGLYADKLTLEASALVRKEAPVFYERYKALFPEELTGVPVGIHSKPLWLKPVLVLKNGIEPKTEITTTKGLFAFLENDVAHANPRCNVVASPYDIVNQWVIEQGSYLLNSYGVGGFFCAAAGDKTCATVPIERLPGFQDFFTRLMKCYADELLSDGVIPGAVRETVGYVRRLGDFYSTSPYAALSAPEGDFTIHVLSPEQPAEFTDPFYAQELALPASGRPEHAAGVARFVEWLYASQENYDMVLYGRPGVDFDGSGGRFRALRDGKPQELTTFYHLSGLVFSWPGADVFGNTDYLRLPAGTPANLEELTAEGIRVNLRPPMDALVSSLPSREDTTPQIAEQITSVVRAREDILYGLFYGIPSADTIADAIDRLSKCKNDWLVEQYDNALKGLAKSVK